MARKAVSLEYGQTIDVVTDQGTIRIVAEAGQKTIVHVSPKVISGLVGEVEGFGVAKGRAYPKALRVQESDGQPRTFDLATVTVKQVIRRPV